MPLFVTLVAVRQPQWYPVHDEALAELKVRDVWSRHPPLVGLAGRIGKIGEEQGSHPGPLAFYVMAVPHRLLGDSSWGFQASTVLLQASAVGVALWLAHRRGGLRFTLAVAAALAVLMRAYGAGVLAEPWLPYLPLVWFVVFLLAIWAVLDRDLLALPAVVLAGSLCAQTHVSYGLVVGAGVTIAGVAAVRQLWLGRGREPDPTRRRDRWTVAAAATLGLLAWLPPLADQLGSGQGNLTRILAHFRSPPEAPFGMAKGFELLLVLLDPWRLVANRGPIDGFPTTGSVLPGAALLLGLAGAAVVAWRLGLRSLLRLQLLLGATVGMAGLSLGRIIGPAWNYLTLFVWSLTALVLLAVLWSGAAALGRARPRLPVVGVGTAGAVVVLVVAASLLAFDGARVDPPSPRLSRLVAAMAPGTAAGLARGDLPGGGRAGRYLVTYTDPVNSGYPTFGLLDELDRRGFDVGFAPYFRAAVGAHRVVRPGDATGEIHVAVGRDIGVWRARRGAVEVAYHDPRSAADRAEQRRIEAELARALGVDRGAGPAPGIEDPPVASPDPRVRSLQVDARARLAEIGLPTAVFVAPAT